jgi:hypothetical protein
MKRHIDAQKQTRWYTYTDGCDYPYREALCGQGAYVTVPPDDKPSGQWADETHPADCARCLKRLAKMDPDEARDTLTVEWELAIIAAKRAAVATPFDKMKCADCGVTWANHAADPRLPRFVLENGEAEQVRQILASLVAEVDRLRADIARLKRQLDTDPA